MAIKPGAMGRPSGPTHRTNEERNTETRRALINAAIHCLRTYGYAATSVTLVAEMARLSRGAVLYQFGTKVDLILAVAAHVVKEQNQFIKDGVQKFAPGRDRWIGLTEVTWDSVNQPGSQALLEIMMASRSDPDLGDRFPALAEELANTQRRGAWSLAKLAGITDQQAVENLSQINRAAMEGLTMRALTTDSAKAAKPLLKLLIDYKIHITDTLIAQAQLEAAKGQQAGAKPAQAGTKKKAKA